MPAHRATLVTGLLTAVLAVRAAPAAADVPYALSTIHPDGGPHVSLVLDGAGDPHVAWFDAARGDLRYARRSGTAWTVELVDSAGRTGLYCSLALDASGRPGIAYYDSTNGNLRLARKSGSAWQLETVQSANDVGAYASLAFTAAGNPRISYFDATNGDLRYAAKSGSLWAYQVIESAGDVGRHTSLALDALGVPHVAYSSGRRLRYASGGGPWTIEQVDSVLTGSDATSGLHATLRVDGTNRPHVAYVNAELGFGGLQTTWVRHAYRFGPGWSVQTVTTSGLAPLQDASLGLGPGDVPHVSWTSARFDPLGDSFSRVYVARPEGPSWVVDRAADLDAHTGFAGTSLAVNAAGDPLIATTSPSPESDLVLLETAHTIALDDPNAGEPLAVSQQVTIRWTTTLLPASDVRLEFGAPGQPRQTIASSTQNDGAFVWTVPFVTGAAFRLYVSDAFDGVPTDSSDVPFPMCEALPAHNAFTPYSTPNDLVAADFNEDGILDVVTCLSGATSGFSVSLGTGSAGVGNGGLAAPVVYQASGGSSVRDAVARDWNRDGILDLAVSISGGVQVFLGLGSGGVGNGAFVAGAVHAAQSNPRGLASADFDEDGHWDVAVANGSSNTVSILRGTGAGAFHPAAHFTVGASPSRIVVDDFDEDGIYDLAITCSVADAVSVLLGNGTDYRGNGTFAPAISYPAGDNPLGIAVGDFDRDGIRDLVVACAAAHGLSVLFGDGPVAWGDGTFLAPVTHPFGFDARDVAVADVNRDGRADLAASTGAGNGIVTFFGNGAGATPDGTFSFGSLVPGDALGNQLALGDFLEDGAPDVLATFSTSSSLMLFRGQCSGPVSTALDVIAPAGGEYWLTGSERTIRWTAGPGVPAVDVEVSRDGGANWETIASDVTDDTFTWTVTGPTTGAARVRVVDAAVHGRSAVCDAAFTIADGPFLVTSPNGGEFLRGFERATITWASNAGGAVDLAYRVGAGPLQSIVSGTANDGAHTWNLPDVGSAQVRVVVTNGAAQDSSDAFFEICRRFAPPLQRTLPRPGHGMAVGDFNEDGILDVATGGCAVQVSLGTGTGGVGDGGFGAAASYLLPDCGEAVAAGDFDDDGILDLAAAAGTGVTVLLGKGAAGGGAFATAATYALGSAVKGIVVADFDEDGIEDLAVAAHGTDRVGVLRGLGSGGLGAGTFAAPRWAAVADGPSGLVAGDFDEDGIWDLAVSHTNAPTVTVLLGRGAAGDGDGTFDPAVACAAVASDRLLAADVDADGITDLVLGSVVVLPGLGAGGVGNGQFGAAVSSSVGIPAAEILDLDGDTRPDLVLAGGGTAGVALNIGSRRFVATGTLALGADPRHAAVSDFLEDGVQDLAALTAGDPALSATAGGACGAAPATLSLRVLTPDPWAVGSSVSFQLTRHASVHLVDLEVSRNGGTTWETIARRVTGDAFAWTVTGPASANVLVRARDALRPNLRSTTTTPRTIAVTADAPAAARDGAYFSPARPNPSRGAAEFELALPAPAEVAVEVFDLAGRHVASLARGPLDAGRHRLRWSAAGADVRAGIYFVRARWPGFEAVRRVVRVD